MNFGVSSRMRSFRSAVNANVVTRRSNTSGMRRTRVPARFVLPAVLSSVDLNLSFNGFRLLLGFCFGPSPHHGSFVRQQGDQCSNNENGTAYPNPGRKRVIESLDDRFSAVGSCSCEDHVDITSVEVVWSVVNRNDTHRLGLGS